MTYAPSKTFTCEEFISQYGDDPRYELIDRVLRDLEPTGPHESVAGKVAGYLFGEILRSNLRWTIPKNCLIRPPAAEATALRSDVIVLDEERLQAEPLWEREPMGNLLHRQAQAAHIHRLPVRKRDLSQATSSAGRGDRVRSLSQPAIALRRRNAVGELGIES